MNVLSKDQPRIERERPGALDALATLLTSLNGEGYVRAVPTIAGSLFFEDAHLPDVREAIAAFFDAYMAATSAPLTWVMREEAPSGEEKVAFSEAESLRATLEKADGDDILSLLYTGGEVARDASPWNFEVVGVPAWKARMGDWGLSGVRFSVPQAFFDQIRDAFVDLFAAGAERVRAIHGYAGHSLNLSPLRYLENQSLEAFVAPRMLGFDAGNLTAGAVKAHLGIKTVGWLTAISTSLLEKVGGEQELRSLLTSSVFNLTDYGAGVVVQAGDKPDVCAVDCPLPAAMVLVNEALRSIRTDEVRLHYASANGDARLIGESARDWLARLDVPLDQVRLYRDQLLMG